MSSIASVVKSFEQQLEKMLGEGEFELKPIPDNIEEFAQLIKIRSGDKLVPFNLYKHQKVFLNLLDNHQYVLGIKSRQMGATQVAILYFLFKAINNPAYSALIFSKTQEDTSLLAFRCKEMIKSLEGYVQLDNDNLKTIRITGGGVLYFRNSKIDGARGIDSVSDILYDEAAFVTDIDKIYAAAAPTQRMTGDKSRTIVLSTPNGVTGWYYDRASGHNPEEYDLLDICAKVRRQEVEPIQTWSSSNGWGKFIAHWRCHPIYGENDNYLQEIAEREDMPIEQVNQEYDLSFEDSSERIFPVSVVRSACVGEWEKEAVENAHYYIGLDPQFAGDDFAVCSVIKHDYLSSTFHLVDWYRKRQQSKDYHLNYIYDLIDKYNPEKIAIEVNSGGQLYYEEMSKEYPHLIFTPVYTSEDKKNNMVNRLLLLLERGQLILPDDKNIKHELLSFERQGKRMCASANNHDDIVMSLAITTSILPEKARTSSFLDQGNVY